MSKVISLEEHTDEAVIIKKALQCGHKNPRGCPKQQNCIYADGADRKIKQYKTVDASKIIPNNVRFQDIDTAYCKTELQPLIERHRDKNPKSFGLEYPLLVEQRGDYYDLVHGHNRFWTLINEFNSIKVPVFVLENKGTLIQKLTGKIQANSKSSDSNREYNLLDVAEQMREFESAGYFTDLGNKSQTDLEFNILMNKLHPNQFLHPVPRGRIKKTWLARSGQKATSIIPYDSKFRDDMLHRNGYPSITYQTEKGKNKTYEWPYFTCDKKKAIIGVAVDNGDLTVGLIFKLMASWIEPEYSKSMSEMSVHLFYRINKPNPNIVALRKRRREILESLIKYNDILKKYDPNGPKIEKVIFPKQLKTETTDTIFVWDGQMKKFKEK